MEPEKIDSCKSRLIELKAQAESRVRDVEETAGFDTPESEWSGELSSYDNHTADSASALEMRSINLGLIHHGRDIVAQIESALERIADGSYGKCDQCGRDIPPERLDAIPWTTSCAQCKADSLSPSGRSGPRPIEEEVVRPPFGGRDPARAYDDPGIHGEDIWDALAEYGTANSPQDEEAGNSGDVDSF
ncbi:MAG: TraR/DksA C4-type zinc finger protein [Bacillota bacterium]|jgi:YteA family regulatory protein|nr:conjugal transfer protein TraR [Bacillota bacterium]HOB41817.1 TraR/DksA C4-type zinc finger protein [Bacillota bacterium]HOK71011.1 TraR/DksA C4-type zinc finger protein [Bacillota bacterium]HOL52642.1 TraR/DksA C4-type zinc finger protein [Bacillota bacterium]HOO29468.1 TraR/DksA C4-type zinc finger protein [Bacillota bacterium]